MTSKTITVDDYSGVDRDMQALANTYGYEITISVSEPLPNGTRAATITGDVDDVEEFVDVYRMNS